MTVTAVDAPRAADLQTLVEMLTTQHAQKCDMIVPATRLRALAGQIIVSGADPVMDENGVTDPNGTYDVTETLDDGISDKLGIPRQYLRRLHTERVDLWDANVNGWLHGGTFRQDDEDATYGPDGRVFLLRTFVSEERRVARALLSDSYKIVDNLDILVAVLAGVQASGVKVDVLADLTDRKMYVRLVAPEVEVLATELLAGYRSPFAHPEIVRAGRAADSYGGRGGYSSPNGSANTDVVNAGLVIQNSEVGKGGYSITPRAEFKVCRNGMVMKADMVRGVHLGGKQSEGIVQFAQDTQRAELDVIVKKTRDAVSQFLDPEYVRAQLAKIAEDMQVPVSGAEQHVTAVAKKLAFAPETMKGVLDHFILGGQLTSGGVMQAVTSYAQTVSDADLAAELEEVALDVLATSASMARAAR